MLRTISFNILFDSEDERPVNWKSRRKLVQKLLQDYDPEIIATQEGKQAQLDDLATLLPNHQYIHLHRHWIDSRMYPSFYIKEGINVIESGDIWLSETPFLPGSTSFGSMFPRICTWSKIQYNEIDLLIANCHLDHVQTDTRQKQTEVMMRELEKINPKKLPLILMGDFNEGPTRRVREAIDHSSFSLIDPWQKNDLQEETSYHKYLNDDPPKDFAGERIDWILHDPRFSSDNIKLLKDSYDGKYPSDHYPILVDIKV